MTEGRKFYCEAGKTDVAVKLLATGKEICPRASACVMFTSGCSFVKTYLHLSKEELDLLSLLEAFTAA